LLAGGTAPAALDAGERVLAADLYAARAGDALARGDPKVARSFLTQAVEQLDLALAAIPVGTAELPDSALGSPRSRRAVQAEPGRFRRDRLAAYRESLRTQLAEVMGDTALPYTPSVRQERQAREESLAAAEVVRQAVRPLLAALGRDRTGELVARLRPRAEDYERVFQPESVEIARRGCEELWQTGFQVQVPASQSEIHISVVPAGMFSGDNEMSRCFPEGYRRIARQLQPQRVWVAWEYFKPGETSGLAFDGLVWCDDHWSWFPKPFRLFAPA
jgi:hypothetical protein